MATATQVSTVVKQADSAAALGAPVVVSDQLEAFAREGARQMLRQALEAEVDDFLGRGRYARNRPQGDLRGADASDSPEPNGSPDEVASSSAPPRGFRGYRNGFTPRSLTLGSGTIRIGQPRVRDIPVGQEPFESKILKPYQRRSDTISTTFMQLFIEGLATRDFEPALRLLVGRDAALSNSVISRLTQEFRGAYEAFERRSLADRRYVYIWADGIYLKAGLGTEKACLMVLVGADTEGCKHLIALREGYRESAASWGELIRDCRQRGLNEPACWIADGALGLWAAVNEHSRNAAQQRCTMHKTMNVVDKLPKRERPEYVARLREIWEAANEPAARQQATRLITDLQRAGYDRAAACLQDDLDRCLAFFAFPEAHWRHVRTTNVIESPFAAVRLRTNAAKRFKKSRSAVHLVFQVLKRLEKNWHRLRSPQLCATVPLPQEPKPATAEAAA